jgi:5-methyltetrahydrofolate--homocysteine methyltransferase
MSRGLDALHSGRVLLMDGAMGTELQRAGIPDGECYEYWNLTHPETVRAIHSAYVAAGAEVLVTNTFQANPRSLERFGLANDFEAITEAGIARAREVAGPDRFVLASVGPFPEGSSVEEIRRTVLALISADGLLLETASGHHDLSVILSNAPPRIPLLFSLTFLRTEDGSVTLHFPVPLEDILRFAHGMRLPALGLNCGRDIGLDDILGIVRRYREATDVPIFARPNAGTPTRVADRWEYPLTPQALADRLPKLFAAGITMIGGCCGTTPEHIAAMKPVVDAWNERVDCPVNTIEVEGAILERNLDNRRSIGTSD